MMETAPIRNLGGKAAVFGGRVVLRGKIAVLVGQEVRFLPKDQWDHLPPWIEPVSFDTGRGVGVEHRGP